MAEDAPILPAGEPETTPTLIVPPEAPPPAPVRERHRITFTGNSHDYFRIWIVNLVLTVLTLGIYLAWARVRSRQYFYRNTHLAGHSFDYLGNPIAILKGNLLVGGIFALYSILVNINPLAAGLVFLAVYAWIPFFIQRALRFNAGVSAWRNIRFSFHGTVSEAYGTYLGWGFLNLLTLGLLTPFWVMKQREYFYDNLGFGTRHSHFRGRWQTFYKVHLLALGASIPVYILFLGILFGSMDVQNYAEPQADIWAGFPWFMIPGYFFLMLGIAGVGGYLKIALLSHCLRRTNFGRNLRLDSRHEPWPWIGISITNTLLIGVTLGLAFPYAKIRAARYLLENTRVETEGNLEDLVGGSNQQASAVGDSSVELLGFDIGF